MNSMKIHDLSLVNSDSIVNIVFIHGLTGDPFKTWGYSGLNPTWRSGWIPLVSPYNHDVNFFSVQYRADAFSSPLRRRLTLFETAKTLRMRLINAGLGGRNIIFVCHSLGGILLKQMLRTDAVSQHDKGSIIACTRNVFFIGTPHRGAKWANRLLFLAWPFVSSTVKNISYLSSYLDDLNEWYIGDCALKIKTASFYEIQSIFGFDIVGREGLRIGASVVNEIALERNHVSACKPTDPDDPVAESIRNAIGVLGEENDAVVQIVRDIDVKLRCRLSFLHHAIGQCSHLSQLTEVANVIAGLTERADTDQKRSLEELGRKVSIRLASMKDGLPEGEFRVRGIA